MTRPGFAFSTRFKVRYAEIDGQRVVFNSRYLEYADVAETEYWEWTGIGEVLGKAWLETEFHVRRASVDYLRPLVWGDTIEASLLAALHFCLAPRRWSSRTLMPRITELTSLLGR